MRASSRDSQGRFLPPAEATSDHPQGEPALTASEISAVVPAPVEPSVPSRPGWPSCPHCGKLFRPWSGRSRVCYACYIGGVR